MRVGIFGGTFDPVHYGHLLLAEQCREQCQLDQIWFLPAGVPPHKVARTQAAPRARGEMLELALAGHEAFRVDDRELHRTTPCFTVETLRELRQESPENELFFLMGADSLRDFPTWREPRAIVELAQIAVVNRQAEQIASARDALSSLLGPDLLPRIHSVTIPLIDLSSSDIRQRVRAGQSIRFMTPRAVECYIAGQALYRDPVS
ncbi:MAG: nicotinate (nicotinamide) nucleotide adenylyltransferase [Planctomycetes bacterium]|nr:nicotinate (nicotinamide) nucleotide adenylyltransferase [Planctomycetota bacterium]